MCKSYEGWANYPTWNIALWIDNTQGVQQGWLETARFYYDEYGKEEGTAKLADYMKECYEMPMFGGEGVTGLLSQWGTASVWHDTIGWMLGMVEWRELAQHYINGYLEERDYEKKNRGGK